MHLVCFYTYLFLFESFFFLKLLFRFLFPIHKLSRSFYFQQLGYAMRQEVKESQQKLCVMTYGSESGLYLCHLLSLI